MSRPHFPRRPPRRLRKARLARDWTIAELANEAHLSLPYVSALELGQKAGSAAAWAQLARALSAPVESIQENSPAGGNQDDRQLDLLERGA
jgi:transcriptional regulator with XRE-family HTH domain